MLDIGINGFGRIGKIIFLQLLEHKFINVCAINAPNIDIKYMETYLKYDSVHKYNTTDWNFKIIDNNHFQIKNKLITVLKNRNAKELNWKSLNINYVIDATGAYLTTEKCKDHNVDYVIMCAPPKDKSPLFVYKVNDQLYSGEKIVSNASCTTNCITPVLKFLNDKYTINNANFTTIHSTTASQTTVDIVNSNNRTHRSILNNIIPHSTGASSSIFELIPSLTNKIYGTSLRVPVSNVSLVDLNVELKENTTFEQLINDFQENDFIQVNSLNLVSTDFVTTTCPSIIDKKASMHLGDNRYKIMIWYDNEWSYSAQVIKLVEVMFKFNQHNNNQYFIDSHRFTDKNVIVRVDWNVPTKNNIITDDFRIRSSLPTIERILNDNPKRVIIISHFGRPNGYTEKYSWKNYLSTIQTYFNENIKFLQNGLSELTLNKLQKSNNRLFLLENIRFYDEETNFLQYNDTNNNEAIEVFKKLGDFFVNDAFGCMHREHLSICGFPGSNKAFGYLVNKELEALKILLENKDNKKILAIIGGAKVNDKLPLLDSLSKKMDNIYIAGGNINGIIRENDKREFIESIKNNKAKIHLMKDGYHSSEPNNRYFYHNLVEDLPENENFYDIGFDSIDELNTLIKENDVIFWNGTLGIVENKKYEVGSHKLVELLINSGKQVIVGGGDTAGYVNKYPHNFTYVSTGGGSVIEYISNSSLVGVDYFYK